MVVSGAGRLQTLTTEGFSEQPLHPGDVVWFTPGTIHRAINDGDLQVLVLMQNSGLPEAGDAVLTFPPQHLRDRATYEAARDLTGPDGTPSAERARRRRDLAVEGSSLCARPPTKATPPTRGVPRVLCWSGRTTARAVAHHPGRRRGRNRRRHRGPARCPGRWRSLTSAPCLGAADAATD